MKLRTFNDAGIKAFRQFLQAARDDSATPVPFHLLEDDALTAVVDPHIEVEERNFRRRADAAECFRTLLEPLNEHRVANDAGLWTWLTLFYFDEVCPMVGGNRSVKNDYAYIFEPKNSRHFYRHRLFLAWYAITLSPQHNRLFLGVTVPTLDKVSEEVFKRLFLTRIPAIFELLDRLYWDPERGRVRPGMVSPGTVKPGDLVHRLPIRIRQLEKTYDLISLNADQLLELLGPEFQQQEEAVAAV